MTFHIITIFPEIFDSYFNEGILKRAQEMKKIEINIYNLRDFTKDKHRKVDDTPYGGGPGMVLKIEPIYECLEKIKSKVNPLVTKRKLKVLLTSAKGKEYTQTDAEKLGRFDDIVIICGRYEGVDERVAGYLVDGEFSVGKYVLTGGEIPAMVVVDSVTRLLDGVLGNQESLSDSAFKSLDMKFEKDHPVFTKPEIFQGKKVPKVLLSGHHKKIENWRKTKNKN